MDFLFVPVEMQLVHAPYILHNFAHFLFIGLHGYYETRPPPRATLILRDFMKWLKTTSLLWLGHLANK